MYCIVSEFPKITDDNRLSIPQRLKKAKFYTVIIDCFRMTIDFHKFKFQIFLGRDFRNRLLQYDNYFNEKM